MEVNAANTQVSNYYSTIHHHQPSYYAFTKLIAGAAFNNEEILLNDIYKLPTYYTLSSQVVDVRKALFDDLTPVLDDDSIYFATYNRIYKMNDNFRIEHIGNAKTSVFNYIQSFHVVRRQFMSNEIELNIIDGNSVKRIFNNGTISVICGSEREVGFSGDGGLAISATLNSPRDLFVWKEELFILDSGNNRIRKISKDGIISTIAGTGEGSTFNYQGSRRAVETPISPIGFSCSSSGIIYLKEYNRISVIDLNGMMIRILYNFKYDFSNLIRVITLSNVDQVYLSDSDFIKKLDLEFGNFTIIAGNIELLRDSNSTMDGYLATQVSISPNSLFIGQKEGKPEIYFFDNPNLIRKIDSNGKIWTIFGARKGTIEYFSIPANYSSTDSPKDVSVTQDGDIIFYDNKYIRKIKSNGNMQVIAGPNIYLDKCTTSTDQDTFFDTLTSKSTLNIAVSANKVFGILRNTDSPNTDSDRLIMLNNNQVCSLYATRKYQDNQAASKSILNDPKGLFVMGDIIYFADSRGHRVFKIENSILTSLAGNGLPGFGGDGELAINSVVNRPSALYVTDQGDVYVCDSGNHRVRKINAKTGIITTVAGNGLRGYNSELVLASNTSLNEPRGVFVTSNNEILIADTGNQMIRKVNSNGFISTLVGSGNAGNYVHPNLLLCELNNPTSIQQDQYGTIFFADTNNHVIRKIGYNNRLEVEIGELGNGGMNGGVSTSSLLYYPESFHIYSYSYALIADTANNRLRNWKLNKVETDLRDYVRPTSVFSISKYSFEYYFTSNDKIYYVNKYSNGGSVTVIAGGVGDGNKVEFSKLSLGGIHATRDYLYIADTNNNLVRRILMETGVITTIAGTGDYGYSGDYGLALKAKLASPTCVFVSQLDDVYICDTENHAIRKIDAKSGIIYTIAGIGVKGQSEENIKATMTKINSPTRIYVSPNSEVFFIQTVQQGFTSEYSKVSKISKDGILTILPFDSVTSISGFPNSNELVVISGTDILKLSPTCPSLLYTLSNDNTICVPVCGGVSSEYEGVCSHNGTCQAPNTCICNIGYNGTNCEFAICSQGCQFGKCTKPNDCTCNDGYYGRDCSLHNTNWIISISVLIGFFSFSMVALVLITVSCILYRRYRREKIILQADTSLSSKLLTGFDTELDFESVKENSYSTFLIPLEQLNVDKPIKRLGGGAFGFVLKCAWNRTIVAVKIFDLNNMNISEEDFTLEAGILSSLRHPNIVNFYGVSFSPTKRYIVCECMEQSLEQVISNLQNGILKLPLIEKVKMLLDISKGINYLHTLEKKIIHRDLKPANILLDKNGICKLCDFGLSRTLSKNTFSALTNHIGTLLYWAPETQLNDQVSRSEATAIDVYSFAIVMYQLLFDMKDPYIYTEEKILKKLGLSTPTTFNNLYQLNRQIVDHEYRPTIPFSKLEECKEWCEEYLEDDATKYDIFFELCELTKQCWAGNPNNRPTTTSVIEKLSLMENEFHCERK